MPYQRNDSFRRWPDNSIVRRRTPRSGTPYSHTCPLAAFQRVAEYVDAASPETDLRLSSVVKALDLPFTQADVALGFLDDVGSLYRCRRRPRRSDDPALFESAMADALALPLAQ